MQKTTHLTNFKVKTFESLLDFARGKVFPEWPIEIFLEVSNVCDLECAMCPIFSPLNPKKFLALKADERGYMNKDAVLPLLDDLLKHAVHVHCFGYGEPMIHPEFKDFISAILPYEVLIDFSTNGMHLTDEMCSFLVESSIWKVIVSFSGITKREYESMYLRGQYDAVLSGIKKLSRLKRNCNSAYPIIQVNSIAFEHHVRKLDQFVDLMADHGVNSISLQSLITIPEVPQLATHRSVFRPWVEGWTLEKAHKKAEEYGVILNTVQYRSEGVSSEEEYEAARRSVFNELGGRKNGRGQDNRIENLKKLATQIRYENSHQEDIVEKNINLMDIATEEALNLLRVERSADMNLYCFEPFSTFYVSRNGSVKPCCETPPDAPAMGNVHSREGHEIWKGNGFNIMRYTIVNGLYPSKTCKQCLEYTRYKKEHEIVRSLREYAVWYLDSFKVRFPNHEKFARRIQNCGANSDIAKTFIRNHPRVDIFASKEKSERGRARPLVGATSVDCPYNGYVDGIVDNDVHGWAWNCENPGEVCQVDIYDGDELISTVTANLYNHDVAVAGIGSGKYGFAFKIPERLLDGKLHRLYFVIRNQNFELHESPYYYISNLGNAWIGR